MPHWFERILNFLVPFGPVLRAGQEIPKYQHLRRVLTYSIPTTFFAFWIFSFLPFVGGFVYMLVLVPLSAAMQIGVDGPTDKAARARVFLLYYTVILIGFGSIWSFIGHTVLAESVAKSIGWQTGSPFQTELAFYTLGSGVAGIMAVWLRGHLITALVISKSIFLYGAAYVHVHDAIANANYSPLNIGTPLVGDIIYPTLLLALLWISGLLSTKS